MTYLGDVSNGRQISHRSEHRHAALRLRRTSAVRSTIAIMPCPFPDCQSSEAKIEVRYGAREVECPSCGKFKMEDRLFDSAAAVFGPDQSLTGYLRDFIKARNKEGKIPMLTDENWQMLANEQRLAGMA